jgi:hypothetical protein
MLKKFLAVGFVLTILYFFIPEIAKISAIIALLWLAASKLSEVTQKSKFVWVGFSVVVFLVSFAFVFSGYFQMTFLSIKEKLYTIDLRLGSDPETVNTGIQRKTSDRLELVKRIADSLDNIKTDSLVAYARRDPANAKLYMQEILAISDGAEKRNEAIGKFRKSVIGSNYEIKNVVNSVPSSYIGKRWKYFVEAGVPARTGIQMSPGEGFVFFADSAFSVFDNQKQFSRYEKKEVNPNGPNKYWEQTDETEEMILEGLPGSNPMVVTIERMK